MRKIKIANRIHQEAGIPQEKAARLLESIVDLLKPTLQKGEPIIIPNFGKFMVRSKATRGTEFFHRRGHHDPRTPSSDLYRELPSQS